MHKLNFEKGQKADSATKFIVSTENVINNLFINFFPRSPIFRLGRAAGLGVDVSDIIMM